MNEQRKRGRYRNFVNVACWLPPAQHQELKRLSAKTGTTQQAHIREAITDLVAKHAGRAA